MSAKIKLPFLRQNTNKISKTATTKTRAIVPNIFSAKPKLLIGEVAINYKRKQYSIEN